MSFLSVLVLAVFRFNKWIVLHVNVGSLHNLLLKLIRLLCLQTSNCHLAQLKINFPIQNLRLKEYWFLPILNRNASVSHDFWSQRRFKWRFALLGRWRLEVVGASLCRRNDGRWWKFERRFDGRRTVNIVSSSGRCRRSADGFMNAFHGSRQNPR